MSFLAQMAGHSAERVGAARARRSEAALLAACAETPPPPPLRLAGFDLIAEIKRNSPAEGALALDADVPERAADYAATGAAAISVLTEPARFSGSLDDLAAAAVAAAPRQVPVMRKDFLVDPWQVLEAREAGAGGVLLIVAMLTDDQLDELLAAAAEQGLFVLLEAFDEADLERAANRVSGDTDGAPRLVGVNSRDLRTLAVDPARLGRLASCLPPGVPAVAESGLHTADDAAAAAALGYAVALVGTALMRAAAPAKLAAAMIAAGRQVHMEKTG
ncbi:indole-3-glycerol-phosphate synthase [Wenzhouxiangella sp. XN24]|uniref:indole-3-glycerol-phosphate synthase n=1 Tax=Wenzhouxiangella sp. XN24 TaxID=2713569 RepID=UPI0013ED0E02|nr:indole-3-glycerol-phosphate synthase [Wenzhouxiangella sp. XN24]NGX17375.1 indole-3-glycerol-phosphate synthase [Wenzhouxiangella sp. XN24]